MTAGAFPATSSDCLVGVAFSYQQATDFPQAIRKVTQEAKSGQEVTHRVAGGSSSRLQGEGELRVHVAFTMWVAGVGREAGGPSREE